jgi:hypothetical protein
MMAQRNERSSNNDNNRTHSNNHDNNHEDLMNVMTDAHKACLGFCHELLQ